MAGFSSVTLIGNLVRDPELRYIPSGTAVSDVTIAVTEREKKNGVYADTTAFVDCVLWGKTAELANEHLQKGSPICFSGSIRQDNWEKDGQKRSKLKVVVDSMTFIGSKSDRPAQVAQPAGVAEDEDPFGF
jgi:single-strand DNA-binding protein